MPESLFDEKPAAPEPEGGPVYSPLAARLAPKELDEFAGQEEILGPGKLLRRAIQAVCEGRDTGDLSTIEDPSALQQLQEAAQR